MVFKTLYSYSSRQGFFSADSVGGILGGVLGTPLRGGESEPSGGDVVGDESLPSTSPKESVTVYP